MVGHLHRKTAVSSLTFRHEVLTDYIPYVADYPQACLEPTNFILSDGATHASWFYSNCSAVVEQHFKYMVKYKIDGIFVQRFYSAIDPSDTYYQATLQVCSIRPNKVKAAH